MKDEKEETVSKENKTNKERTGFFSKVWKSIVKIEKYPELAARRIRKSNNIYV